MNFFLDVLANFVAGLVVFAAAYVWAWLPKREQRRWMGMMGRTPSLRIYASCLYIKPGGAEPVEGETVTVGFTGPAMNDREYSVALALRDSLRSRIIEMLADLFKEQIDIRICPRKWDEQKLDERKLAHFNLVFLGSPIYNSGTKYYLATGDERVKFFLDADNNRRLRIDGNVYVRNKGADGKFIDDYGVICRMNRQGRSIFICAGIGMEATCEAADHLTRRWKEIKRECGTGEFIAFIPWTKTREPKRRPNIWYPYKEMLEKEREYSALPQGEQEQSES